VENEPEILLTKEEIELVCKTGSNPILRHPDVINFGNAHTTIYKVTTNNALIFIKGNKHTGFEHIHERHDFFSFKHFWKVEPNMKSDNKIRLDNPSKFSSKSIPILDYTKIADEVFKPANLNVAGNKRPEVFDVYDGVFLYRDEQKINYRLVLYKGTRIVHSLFPTDKIFNREKVINYAKGSVTATIGNEPYLLIKIPYHDHKQRVAFRILIRKYLKQKKEECFIEALDENGNNILTHRVGERPYDTFDFTNIDRELWHWQLRDLTKEEKIIKQLDKKLRETNKTVAKRTDTNG
jgi:hypothetical protein